ncbi:MAG: DUF4349 domain-containing protein [Phycisphaeraceae bacterium]
MAGKIFKVALVLLVLGLLISILLPALGAARNTAAPDPYSEYLGTASQDRYFDPSVVGRWERPPGSFSAEKDQSARFAGRVEQRMSLSRAASDGGPMAEAMLAQASAPPQAAGLEAASEQNVGGGDPREIIYTATLNLAVENLASTLDYIRAYAKARGGHMEQQSSNMIRIRVPAATFDEVLEKLAGIGELRDKNIGAQDVTSQVRDIEIELKTATTSRDRLLALLEKAERTEDVIQIERELRRLNTQIDQVQGRLRYFKDQVSMSTITVVLNAKVPQEPTDPAMPFVWVDQLAFELLNPTRTPPSTPDLGDGVRIELPDGFVRHYQQDYITMALSSDGVGLKIIRHTNYDEADLDFWLGLVRTTLIDQMAIPVGEPVLDKLDGRWWGKSSTEIATLEGPKTVGAQPHRYLIGLVATDRYVYTVEAWGPDEALAKHRDAITQAMMTLRVR